MVRKTILYSLKDIDITGLNCYNIFLFERDLKMDSRTHEILSITIEECSEVIQAISKIFRFGIDTEWKGETNKEHLEEELGDLKALILLLEQNDVVDKDKVNEAAGAKIQKLEKWSNIFNENK